MTTENCLHGPGITCGLCETKVTDAKATLSPETEQKLREQASKDASEWFNLPTNACLEEWLVPKYHAAATVAVEGMLDPDKVKELELQYTEAVDQNIKLQAELAELRRLPVYEKTTVEEARGVYKVWGDSIGMQVGLVAMAAAIDRLIEKRLPRAGGGMTIRRQFSEVMEKADQETDTWDEEVQQVTDGVVLIVEQAVAEAVAAQKSIAESEAENEWQDRLNNAVRVETDRGNSILRHAMEQEFERHATELQEAVAAEREKHRRHIEAFEEQRAAIRENADNELTAAEERYAAELAELKRHHETLAHECSGLEAAVERHADDLAAKYQELRNVTAGAVELEPALTPFEDDESRCQWCGHYECNHENGRCLIANCRCEIGGVAIGTFERNCAWWLI